MKSSEITDAMRKASAAGNFDQAIRLAEERLADDPNDEDALITKARILSTPDPAYCDYQAAIALLTKARQRNPASEMIALELAQAVKSSGDYGAAEKTYRRLLADKPDDCEFLLGLASLENHPGVSLRTEEVRKLLEHAVCLCPDRWQVHGMLAEHRRRNGDTEGARKSYQDALARLGPDDTFARKAMMNEMRAIE